MFRRFYRYLKSAKLAIILIIVMGVLSIAGITVYEGMFSSLIFLSLTGVFFVNLLLCTVDQSVKLYRRITRKTKETAFNLVINQLGGVLFHWGLVAVTTGALVFTFFGFTGKLGLVEGQIFYEGQGYTYTEKGLLGREYPKEIGVFLHRIEVVEYTENKPYGQVEISILDNGLQRYKGILNEGESREYREATVTFYNFGYFVEMAVQPPGEEAQIQTIGLDTQDHKGYQEYVAGAGILNNKYSIAINFIPNISNRERPLKSGSYLPENPGLYLDIKKNGEGLKDSSTLFKGVVPLGEAVELSDGTKISFTSYHPWATFLITKYSGVYILYFGFIIGIIGMVFRYVELNRKRG